MTAETTLIRCGNCGANNRVRADAASQAVCGKCKSVLSEITRPLYVTDANFAEQVEKSPLPVLLDLWAEWCPPCRLLAPTIDKLAQELAGKVRVGKLDVDKNPMISSRFRARSIPTMLIIKNGREVDRIVGLQSKEAIIGRLKNFL